MKMQLMYLNSSLLGYRDEAIGSKRIQKCANKNGQEWHEKGKTLGIEKIGILFIKKAAVLKDSNQ